MITGDDMRAMGLNGPAGLLAAVIRQGLLDALGDDPEMRADAWAYLAGPEYEHHVTALGLPPDALPAPIKELASEAKEIGILATE